MPKSSRLAVVVLLTVVSRLAVADPEKTPTPTPISAPGEDEQLYSCKHRSGEVAVTFKPETELKDLVTWVMGFTCKNFVLDPRIVSTGKKVTIIAPNKMASAEAYRVFLVALSTIGLTVVPKGSVLRIVESATAKRETVPIFKGGAPDDTDQVVRYILRPSYAQAETLKQAFLSIKSDAGDVVVVGTMVLITDYSSHVRDMMALAKLVDVPGGTEGIYTIPVKHGDATKMSQMLTTFFGSSTPATAPAGKPGADAAAPDHPPSKILVDERTNTLVIAATEPAYERAKALIDRIDVPIDLDGGGSLHVYQLSTAVADDVAQTLTKSLDGGAQSRTAKPPGAPGAPPPPVSTDTLGATIQGQVRIVADNKSNKLIVTASGRDFIAIRDVIRELDVPRRQVFIEMVILEVQLKDGTTLGTSSHGTLPWGGGALAVGGVQAPDLKSFNLGTLTTATGLIGGLVGPLKNSVLGQSIPSYGVLFQALADHSSTNVISSTSQIALDNEDSKYVVGQDIPYTRGTLPVNPTNPTAQTISNIDRKPLELSLTIKPHIAANDLVQLDIVHKSQDLTGRDPVLNEPIWATRNIETKTVVHDQQTVVVGGLLQEREIATATKVPLLGDVPLLGYLFKYTTRQKQKTNLVILLTPYVIKDQSDLQAIRERKLRETEEFTRSFAELSGAKFVPGIDYRRKRGLVEEINQSLLAVEADVEARKAIRQPTYVTPGPIDVPKQ